nr:PREDICTED: thiamine transporter 2-like [Latimeria chalumnae]|eukprot:XP_005993082.1 PREDICTED: thiamine transporter 2-like [Latimeria chalumnae]
MEFWKKVQSSGWIYPTVILCIFGFFSMVRPSEPFLTPYLTGPDKNLTVDQVMNQIYPVWTYSYLVILFPVFLATDYLRYKPVIILEGATILISMLMLLFAEGVLAMQFLEFVYGISTATEVAYYSYIYSMVSPDHYQKVTSYCRSITLVGYTIGSTLKQTRSSPKVLSYFYLVTISLSSTSVAFISSFFLPMPSKSMFFYKSNVTAILQVAVTNGESYTSDIDLQSSQTRKIALERTSHSVGKLSEIHSNGLKKEGFMMVLLHLWDDFKECYSRTQLVYWSLWWILATCGYNQILNYVQVLWNHIEPSQNFTVYNGGVEAISTLTGAAAAFAVGCIDLDWTLWGELALGILSALDAGALYLMDFTDNIWLGYAGYLIFKPSYMLLITISTFQIATNLSMERYALMFGVNTFMALACQTILTAIVVDSKGLGLDIVTQFLIYASYFATISGIFCVRGLYILFSKKYNQEKKVRHDGINSTEVPPVEDSLKNMNATKM